MRELANVLERAAILAEGAALGVGQLALPTARRPTPSATWMDGTLEDLEREAIRRALVATGGHRKNAAERLGIGLRTLYEKLKAYGLE